jgi:hypothetical protein
MTWWEAILLFVGGGGAGVVNSMAGGGSSLTVPLLVLAGVPGNFANGSNRVGILVSNIATVWSFHRQGVTAYRDALPVVLPVIAGSLTGALAISQLSDNTFETIFAILMLPIIILSIREPKIVQPTRSWPPMIIGLVFFLLGVYAGAVQVGVGLVLLAILTRSGFDLMKANIIKVLITLIVTMTALPVFIIQGKVRWLPATILTCGLSIGGWVGARIAVKGGERTIRFFMIVAVIGLTGKLFGLYG